MIQAGQRFGFTFEALLRIATLCELRPQHLQRDAAIQSQGVQEYLHGQGITVEADSIIVFVNPRAVLTVDESAIPIMRVEELSGLLREKAAANVLTGGQRLQIVKLLTAAIGTPDSGEDGKGRGAPTPRPRPRPEPETDSKPGRPRRIIGARQR